MDMALFPWGKKKAPGLPQPRKDWFWILTVGDEVPTPPGIRSRRDYMGWMRTRTAISSWSRRTRKTKKNIGLSSALWQIRDRIRENTWWKWVFPVSQALSCGSMWFPIRRRPPLIFPLPIIIRWWIFPAFGIWSFKRIKKAACGKRSLTDLE